MKSFRKGPKPCDGMKTSRERLSLQPFAQDVILNGNGAKPRRKRHLHAPAPARRRIRDLRRK